MKRTNPELAEARAKMTDTNSATRDEQLAVAWTAGATVLSDAAWHQWESVINIMADASDLHPRECAPLLTGACHAGLLVRQAVAGDRCVRATRKGQTTRPELRSIAFSGAL